MISVRLVLVIRGTRIGCGRADGRALSDAELWAVREMLPVLSDWLFGGDHGD